MSIKKLISPEFKVIIGEYEITNGISVECVSSKSSHIDWCKIELSTELQGLVNFRDMDNAEVCLGYDDDFDLLINGYARVKGADVCEEIIIKDDSLLLSNTTIKATFLDSTPQDIIRYILCQAGISNYNLSTKAYGKKRVFSIRNQSANEAIKAVNNAWGISNDFFFQSQVFYWGCKPLQQEIYTLEEGETLIRLEKIGSLWEAETLAIPWIHHSQTVEVIHSKFTGSVEVVKTIIRSNSKGFIKMFIYFGG